ncbi:NADH dehydrogenase [Phanerochaete sordida]|uniref:NADH dehydrogenase n=1 Tax=Phanerochaete sordida TaxID=48140 RepID=A0A9P3G5W6_9APHY|nr:NADH dehydrogenase [Phanerochaete sordida]
MAHKAPLTRTVAVLGGSYGGHGAATTLAHNLPENWRVVVIDRNSHMNHLYVFPRYSVVPGHDHKAFIPYTGLFNTRDASGTPIPPQNPRHAVVHASVLAIAEHTLTLSRAAPEAGVPEPTLTFDYLVYAAGSHQPAPIDLWGARNLAGAACDGTQPAGVRWMQAAQARVRAAPSVLVVGGGALGIQYATDIASAYPEKRVTILHSRAQLLPKFDAQMHERIVTRMAELKIDVILGERLDLSTVPPSALTDSGEHVLRTLSGREIRAGLVLLCTGQRPNTELLSTLAPDAILPDGQVRITPTMQVAASSGEGAGYDGLRVLHPHIFVIGDAADAFGECKLGHCASSQGKVAANNILKLVRRQEGSTEEEPLDTYTPGPPGIKLSLGLGYGLFLRGSNGGAIDEMLNPPEDWNAAYMWRVFGHAGVH